MTNIAWARDGWIGRFHKLVEIPHKILRGLPKLFRTNGLQSTMVMLRNVPGASVIEKDVTKVN